MSHPEKRETIGGLIELYKAPAVLRTQQEQTGKAGSCQSALVVCG